jgi:hypothetical protein
MSKDPLRVHIDEALIELRSRVEQLGIRTKSSAGNNEHFYAYLNEINGVPSDGLFIFVRDWKNFAWSRTGMQSISDVAGAAQRIAQTVKEGSEQ